MLNSHLLQTPDAPHWFQLYWSSSDELVESLIARAESAGAEAENTILRPVPTRALENRA